MAFLYIESGGLSIPAEISGLATNRHFCNDWKTMLRAATNERKGERKQKESKRINTVVISIYPEVCIDLISGAPASFCTDT